MYAFGMMALLGLAVLVVAKIGERRAGAEVAEASRFAAVGSPRLR